MIPLKQFRRESEAKYMKECMRQVALENPHMQANLVLAKTAKELKISMATLYRIGARVEIRPKTKFNDGPKVYLMHDELAGAYKIGYTKNCPHERHGEMKTGNPRIKLVKVWYAPKSEERKLHIKFNQYRLSGEWFEFCGDDLLEIDRHMSAYEYHICETAKLKLD